MNTQYAMRQALLILSVVWAGCAGVDEPDQGEVRSAVNGDDPSFDYELSWVPAQGSYILGSYADSLAVGTKHIRASLTPANRPLYRLSVSAAKDGASLIADAALLGRHHDASDADWFVGMTLSASNGGLLTIRDVGTPDPSHVDVEGVVAQPTTTLYAIDYSAPLGGGNYAAPVDYCGTKGGAVVLAGGFNKARIHQDVAAISFGCADAIALKCLFWGYNPGNVGSSPDWMYHQVCIKMGGADYCGTGTSYTRELTPIEIRDNKASYGSDDLPELVHPVPMPGDPDEFYIEAGWDKDGLPICLSRSRWEALPPDPCGSALPDPRSREHVSAQFCDDWTMAQLFTDKKAVLVNGSKRMDMSLHRWQHATTKDEVLTTRGYYIDRVPPLGADPESVAPFAGYVHVGIEGMVLRNLPGSLPDSVMRPIYMQNLAGGDRYLSDVDPGPGQPDAFEGYAFVYQNTTTSSGAVIQNLPAFGRCTRASNAPNVEDNGILGVTTGCAPTGNSLGFALPPP